MSTKSPPEVSAAETVDAIVATSKRSRDFPLRRDFVQSWADGDPRPGPLASLVKAGDHRGLLLYLMLVTKASSEPWDAALPAAVWARALGIVFPERNTARSTVSKAWLRLEGHNLVSRSRSKRLADVYLLREDGLGAKYTNPGEAGDQYFRVPLSLWRTGPDPSRRWYEELSLPELAFTLIGLSLGDEFRLPYEQAPDWYGISADSVSRGAHALRSRGLIKVDQRFKKAPLSPVGYTAEHRYTLQYPFGPTGHKSGSGPRGAR